MFINRHAASLLAIALAAVTLTGCGTRDRPAADKPAEDPALISALQAPIMTDPDLAQQSNAGSALAGGGPPVMELPPIETGPEAVATAKAEALKLVGKNMAALPLSAGEVAAVAAAAVTPAQLAQLINLPVNGCITQLGYGAVWSLRLPASLPIYPRGHLQEAAGTDKAGCKLGVVSYLTPVPANDVLAFYHTRAKAVGVSSTLTQSDAVQVLAGSKADLSMLVRARTHSVGVTSIDLVISSGEQ